MSILNKEFEGKERLTAEFGKGDIGFVSSYSTDGKVLLTFYNAEKEHDLNEINDLTGKTWKEIDPDIIFSFTNPKSIQNIIDALEECKVDLEKDLNNGKL